jgi:hypothetical protein
MNKHNATTAMQASRTSSWTRALGALALTLGMPLATAACTDASSANLSVGGNVIPEQQGEEGCALLQAQEFYTEGVLDLAITDSYFFNADITNRLPNSTAINNSGPGTLRPDYNIVTLTKVFVTVSIPSSVGTSSAVKSPFKGQSPLSSKLAGGPRPSQVQKSWEIPITGTIVPNARLITSFPLIPRETNAVVPIGWDWRQRFKEFIKNNQGLTPGPYSYSERIIVTFEIEGETSGGATMRTGTQTYPIKVCFGCLLSVPSVPAELDDPNDVWRSCSAAPGIPDGYTMPCQIGNNDPLLCNVLCGDCKVRESMGEANACDDRFCPPL